MIDKIDLCPCCSSKEYAVCCKPFHDGVLPENALQLMRSRYSAFALNKPDYIVATTHPANPQYSQNKFSWKRSISQFSRNFLFNKLEILEFKENDHFATVTFAAFLSQGTQEATFTERSYFEKTHGRWLYRSGHSAKGYVPSLVTNKELEVLPLAYYGDDILVKKAKPILEITEDIKKLVQRMVETMDACDGAGIAAPQVHQSLRLFVIRTPIELDGRIEQGDVEVFINPHLSLLSEDTWEAPEGCLSIPTISCKVKRPLEAIIEYTNLEGKSIKRKVSNWEARVIMHEYDHIEGILFIDRLSPEEQRELMPLLKHIFG